MREIIADHIHSNWSSWIKYLFRNSKRNEDGTITISKDMVEKLDRMSKTFYSNLPDNDKIGVDTLTDDIIKLFEIYF